MRCLQVALVIQLSALETAEVKMWLRGTGGWGVQGLTKEVPDKTV